MARATAVTVVGGHWLLTHSTYQLSIRRVGSRSTVMYMYGLRPPSSSCTPYGTWRHTSADLASSFPKRARWHRFMRVKRASSPSVASNDPPAARRSTRGFKTWFSSTVPPVLRMCVKMIRGSPATPVVASSSGQPLSSVELSPVIGLLAEPTSVVVFTSTTTCTGAAAHLSWPKVFSIHAEMTFSPGAEGRNVAVVCTK